jgi:PAS domain S-box-containing protein
MPQDNHHDRESNDLTLGDTGRALRQVLEHTSAVVFVKDRSGRYLFVNQRFCDMMGRPQDELSRLSDADVFPPQVVQRLRADDRRVFETHTAVEVEEALIVNGEACTYTAIKFPLLDAHGKAYALCGIATDITARKRGEEALRSAALGVSTAQGDLLFQELTRYLVSTLGVECGFIALCNVEDASQVRTLAVFADGLFEDNLEYALSGTACGTVVGQEFRFIDRDVQKAFPHDRMFKRWGIEGYAAYPLSDSAGKPLGLIAVMSHRPLTDRALVESMLKIFAARAAGEVERQRTEEACRTSEASYRSIFEATEDAIFIHDLDTGAILDVNPKACEVYGYSREELKRLRFDDISSGVAPYTEAHARARIEQARAGQAVRFEWHRKNKDGSLHWDEVYLKRAVIAGQPRMLAVTREITERKLAEDALRSAALAVSTAEGDQVYEELTRHLCTTLGLDLAFIALYPEDDTTSLRTVALWMDGEPRSPMSYPVAGTPCETVVGKEVRVYPTGVRNLFPHDSWPLAAESYAAYPLFDRNGVSRGLIAVVNRKPMSDAALVESVLKIFAARAVSELERCGAAEALRASEEQHRAIFNTSTDGMVVLDAQGRIVDANPAFLALFGYSREQLAGEAPQSLLSPDNAQLYDELLDTVASGRTFQRECRARRASGTPVDLELRGVPMHHRGKLHVLAIVRDITAAKQAESERSHLEAQLRQAQKMEAIGHLTGGIAHDFNNILTSIMGYIVLAGERTANAGDAKLGRYLEQARIASTRARDLIQQMLTFSRSKRGESRPLSLAPLIKESIKLLRPTLPSTLELRTELEADLPAVRADPVQIGQVLLNLCINARDATPSSGTIRVGLRSVDSVDCRCSSCREQVVGDGFLELLVQDSGTGIAQPTLDRMFEPFFSTKEVGKGSGMGLATVHGIVHEHGGHVVVETALGRGTVFRVLLPVLAAEEAGTKRDRPTRSAVSRPRQLLDGKVLVVEDEEMVGEFMSDLLHSWGLQVVVKHDPVEAHDLFARDPARFDVVVTDYTMPKGTGLDLACRMTGMRPGLPVILYTGYSDDLNDADVRRCGVRALVKKPLDPAAFLAVLRSCLPSATDA